MKDVRHLVGDRVQILRKRKQLSQEELAGKIEIDTKSLSRLERGQHYPSLETLERIRSELGVELKDFFDFDGEPSAEELREFLLRTASKADYESLVKMSNAVKEALKDE
ncbi:helix-turn-helix transcriptional regulator [Undibacterium sp. CY18W]|uniref:Helix-turn-helix transcriptional regulator n=1 Tax=Undibacterium hunanense TaxID=2762292 RepID=A0ABR6ZMQ0_9BURK|nr:helix-turn-helix transcriptional regulator [Undibacterium hunanense]MBC3917079.1 helix-turn-helix transcriptional regulator [Undibacterium hunanense]